MRMHWALTTLGVVLVIANGDRSFVDTAPAGDNPQPQEPVEIPAESNDSNVRQLESLKHSLGKTLAMMKSQSAVYSDVNGHQEAHASSHQEVDADGELVARVSQQVDSAGGGTGAEKAPATKVRTQVDIPARGVHKTILQEEPAGSQLQIADLTDNGSRRNAAAAATNADLIQDFNNNLEKYSSYSSGVQYSPLDMAEYVFWTGDEKGVTLAIEEFLQDGLMTRDEAISFLQEIKFNLDYLQAHYSQQGVHAPDSQRQEQSKERANNIQKSGRFNSLSRARSMAPEEQLKNTYDVADLRKDMEKKSSFETASKPSQVKVTTAKQTDDTITDEEYEVLLERLRVADFLYTQYSLEEVIYQLAKVMFSQSLTRGSAEAQEALQKFTTFLEAETEQGHISRSLEKKVLDVLIAALTDTLTEHPELVAAAREGLGGGSAPRLPPGNNMLQQILEMSPEEKEAAKSSLYAAFKEQSGRQNHLHRDHQQLTHTDRIKPTPIGLGKYKTP